MCELKECHGTVKKACFIFLLLFLIVGCTIQKRHFRKGWNVEWIHHKIEYTNTEKKLVDDFDGNQDAKVQESANGVNAPKAQEVFQFERKRLHFKPIEKIQEKVQCLDNISDSNIFASKNGWILESVSSSKKLTEILKKNPSPNRQFGFEEIFFVGIVICGFGSILLWFPTPLFQMIGRICYIVGGSIMLIVGLIVFLNWIFNLDFQLFNLAIN